LATFLSYATAGFSNRCSHFSLILTLIVIRSGWRSRENCFTVRNRTRYNDSSVLGIDFNSRHPSQQAKSGLLFIQAIFPFVQWNWKLETGN